MSPQSALLTVSQEISQNVTVHIGSRRLALHQRPFGRSRARRPVGHAIRHTPKLSNDCWCIGWCQEWRLGLLKQMLRGATFGQQLRKPEAGQESNLVGFTGGS